MALSMGLIAVVVLVFVGIYGGFSFSPGRPTDDGPAPTADAVQEFREAPRVLPFTPAVPQGVPADWHANSAATTNPATADTTRPLSVRGGWLIPSGRFIGLIASNATAPALLSAEFGQAAPDSGTVQAGGADWTVTTGVRDEVAWIRSVTTGPTEIVYLITGSADEDAFRALAASISGSG